MVNQEPTQTRKPMRTDTHSPSHIIPDDYEYVSCEYLGPFMWEAQAACRLIIKAHMDRTGGTYSHHEHGGNCMVCGSVNMIYSILYYHAKSNSYVRVGEDCARKLDMGGTREMGAFRAAARDAMEAQAGKHKAEATLVAAGLERAWKIYTESDAAVRQGFKWEETTIIDIVGKLEKYGSISEKQVGFLGTLLDKIDHRAEIEAKRAAEAEAAAPCPIGRVTVHGSVLSTKVVDTDFGPQVKMLVRDDSGYKVWCTAKGGAERGNRVRFSVDLTPSDRDPKFGFGKRPTKFEFTAEIPTL